MTKILICSDLDGTLLPNKRQPQSEKTLKIFSRFVTENDVMLAYVSGRDKSLIEKAINDFSIPYPDYAIGGVGTTIYTPSNNWRHWLDWEDEIAKDWNGKKGKDLISILSDLDMLTLQEGEKQNNYKLSFYSKSQVNRDFLRDEILVRLHEAGVKASIIWSVDEQKGRGLFDILPERATKIHAIRFLMKKIGYDTTQTLFAGDSGNDLLALTSDLNAVLVNNSSTDLKKEALSIAERKGLHTSLYIARGNFHGMNGNYCGGILEGIVHFFPEIEEKITKLIS